MFKKCNRCEKEKLLYDFYKGRNTCKQCVKETAKPYIPTYTLQQVSEHRQQQREKWIIFLGSKCQACGLVDNSIVYDFHHKNPSLKDYKVSSLFALRNQDEKISNEIMKCVLVCSHCHRKIHAGLIECP